MKNFYSCLIILTFFASCASEENSNQESTTTYTNKEGVTILPANSSNAYDNAGQLFDELFEAYYDGTSRPTATQSVISQVEAIAKANTSFDGISQNRPVLYAERIEYLANLNTGSISSLVISSGLSSIAKTSFSNFLVAFDTIYHSETDTAKIYKAIVKYEETVIGNASLTAKDQRIILTTTSIIRYSSYRAKKKPKKNTDPYWNIWITHIFGAEEGAEENLEKAILQGLVTGIVSNK